MNIDKNNLILFYIQLGYGEMSFFLLYSNALNKRRGEYGKEAYNYLPGYRTIGKTW